MQLVFIHAANGRASWKRRQPCFHLLCWQLRHRTTIGDVLGLGRGSAACGPDPPWRQTVWPRPAELVRGRKSLLAFWRVVVLASLLSPSSGISVLSPQSGVLLHLHLLLARSSAVVARATAIDCCPCLKVARSRRPFRR